MGIRIQPAELMGVTTCIRFGICKFSVVAIPEYGEKLGLNPRSVPNHGFIRAYATKVRLLKLAKVDHALIFLTTHNFPYFLRG